MIAPQTSPVAFVAAFFALCVLVPWALWFVLIRVGRVADPFRRYRRAQELVAAKVEDNERIALENRIRRHPDFLHVDRENTPVFEHYDQGEGIAAGEHRLNPSCTACVALMESVRV